jgi:shikimate kinase
MAPIVVLAGFSTAGKSTYLLEIKKKHSDSFRISYIDSDEVISKNAGTNHIYNLFMSMGREAALSYIEEQEQLLLKKLSLENENPILLAAGPFLPLRSTWNDFQKERKPFVIHLHTNPEAVYDGLMRRKKSQFEDTSLDQESSHFRSWDKGVTTEQAENKYQDLSREQSINNIRTHLIGATNVYQNIRSAMFSVEDLNTLEIRNKLIALIERELGI